MKRNYILLILLSVFIFSCKKESTTNQTNQLSTIIADSVIVVNNASNSLISLIDQNKIIFNSSNSQIDSIKTGYIIASAPTNITKYGFLRKVINVIKNGSIIEVTTIDASITEAIKQCDISHDYTFDVSDTAGRITANPFRVFDSVLLSTSNGYAKFIIDFKSTPRFLNNIQININPNTKKPYVDNYLFQIDLSNETVLKAISNFSGDFTLGPKKIGNTIPLKNFIFYIGVVPIVVKADLEFYIGAEGNFTTDATIEYTNNNSVRAYVAYSNGQFRNVFRYDTTNNNNFNTFFNSDGNVKGYIKPQIRLSLYDHNALEVGLDPSVYAKATGSYTINSTQNYFKWGLYGGIDGSGFIGSGLPKFLGLSDTTRQNFSLFTYQVTIREGIRNFNQNDGLVAQYKFNGNTEDNSGNGNNGSVVGNISYSGTDRKNNTNSTFNFDGNTYITIPDANSLDMSTNELSISMWVKISTANSVGYRLIDKATPNTPNSGYSFDSYSGTQGTGMRLTAIGNNVTLPYLDFSYSLNQWHHLVVTYTGGNSRFYLNGVFVGGSYHSGTPSIKNMNLPLIIGASNNTYSFKYRGQMDDIRLYNKAITETEIEALFLE